MENHLGKAIAEALLLHQLESLALEIFLWLERPSIQLTLKKRLRLPVRQNKPVKIESVRETKQLPTIPILIKADVLGTIEAIEHELSKFSSRELQ